MCMANIDYTRHRVSGLIGIFSIFIGCRTKMYIFAKAIQILYLISGNFTAFLLHINKNDV